jgi:hypothetical protein
MVVCRFEVLHSAVVVSSFFASVAHSAQTGHLHSLGLSQHILSCSLADLPSLDHHIYAMVTKKLSPKTLPLYMFLWMQT